MDLSRTLLINLNLISNENSNAKLKSSEFQVKELEKTDSSQHPTVELFPISETGDETYPIKTLEQLDRYLIRNENYSIFNDFINLLKPDIYDDVFRTLLEQNLNTTNIEENSEDSPIHLYISQINEIYAQLFEQQYLEKISAIISQVIINFINKDFSTLN